MRQACFFLDTSFILSLINSRGLYHKKAHALFAQLRMAREVLVTESVLTEIGNSLACTNRTAAVNFISSCYVTANLKVVSVDNTLFQQAVEFYHTHKVSNGD